MFIGMAIKTKRKSIGNNVPQFCIISKALYVMRVKVPALFVSASSARIMISLKNIFSPLSIFGCISSNLVFGSHSTFPVWIPFSIKSTLFNSEIPEEVFVFLAKFSSLSWWILSISFPKLLFFLFSQNVPLWRSVYSNTEMTTNIQAIVSRGIRRKLFFWFPGFAFLTPLLGFREEEIRFEGKSNFSCPSPENADSLICCFHGLSQ